MKTLDYKTTQKLKYMISNYYIFKNMFRSQVITASYIWKEKQWSKQMKKLD